MEEKGMNEEIAMIEDDGLDTPEIGSWGEKKYRLVELYSALFAKSMRSKWDCLVYIDLFAGAGRAQIRGTKRIINSSPLIVLGLSNKFDKYIFCEKITKLSEALKKRIKREFPDKNTHIITGDSNQKVDEILSEIPAYKRNFRVLAFCFVDPCALSNLNFETIRLLSERFMDFLVLIPSGMEANRFKDIYSNPDNSTVDEFLGNKKWRTTWKEVEEKGATFERFIVQEFGKSMKTLKYLDPNFDDTILVRSDGNNLLLYRLAFYSRNDLGKKFWHQAKKYSQAQTEMF